MVALDHSITLWVREDTVAPAPRIGWLRGLPKLLTLVFAKLRVVFPSLLRRFAFHCSEIEGQDSIPVPRFSITARGIRPTRFPSPLYCGVLFPSVSSN